MVTIVWIVEAIVMEIYAFWSVRTFAMVNIVFHDFTEGDFGAVFMYRGR